MRFIESARDFPDKWMLFIVLLIGLSLYIYRPNEFVQNIVQTVIGALIGMLIGKNVPQQSQSVDTSGGDVSILNSPPNTNPDSTPVIQTDK